MPPLADAELEQLAYENFVESLREYVRWGDVGLIDETDAGTVRTVGATRFPAGTFNTASWLGDAAPSDPAAWLAAQRACFARHARGFTVHVRAGKHDALAEACVGAGFTQGGDMPVMACDTLLTRPPDAARIVVRPVDGTETLSTLVSIEAAAYAQIGLPETVTRALMAAPTRLLDLPWMAVIAADDDGAQAAALLLFSHGIAGVYWVATHPSAQRRGLAAACMRALTNLALERGARAVILQASEAGAPLYRKLGFRTLGHYRWYFARREAL
jgi:GNAT superfamily N-acetyltransferase